MEAIYKDKSACKNKYKDKKIMLVQYLNHLNYVYRFLCKYDII